MAHPPKDNNHDRHSKAATKPRNEPMNPVPKELVDNFAELGFKKEMTASALRKAMKRLQTVSGIDEMPDEVMAKITPAAEKLKQVVEKNGIADEQGAFLKEARTAITALNKTVETVVRQDAKNTGEKISNKDMAKRVMAMQQVINYSIVDAVLNPPHKAHAKAPEQVMPPMERARNQAQAALKKGKGHSHEDAALEDDGHEEKKPARTPKTSPQAASEVAGDDDGSSPMNRRNRQPVRRG